MTNATATITNPWTKESVEIAISDYAGRIDSCPWPEAVTEQLDGQYDDASEWMAAAIAILGEDAAGTVILGS